MKQTKLLMKKTKALLCAFLLCAPLTAAAADVEINETNFPDANFRAWLLEQEYGKDGVVTEAEVSSVTSIDVISQRIGSLKGIEYFTALKELFCSSNQLKVLDVSKNTALTNLQCPANQLTVLDVSKNPALTLLSCGLNQLTALDVSNNTALDFIECDLNRIMGKAMDAFISSLPQNTANRIKWLYLIRESSSEGNICTYEQIAAIKAKGWTPFYSVDGMNWQEYKGSDDNPSPPAEGIAIDETTFPDANFRAYLLRQDYGRDGVLTETEIKGITALYVSYQSISSLKGVEYFTALTDLQCYNNQLTSLDVSGCKSLTAIYCNNNKINGEGMDTFINSLPEKTAGEWANIYIYNALKGEEGNVCTSAQVAAIKAKGWHPLYCTEIDGNTSRWSEYPGNDDDPSTPGDNPSTPDGIAIDETNFPDANFRAYLLRQDYGRDGVLTETEIKGITALYVSYQSISSLKGVEYFTALTNLQCYNNQLTSLDVSGCKSLTAIHCNNNKINGEGMDTFINSLPEKTAGEWANIYIYNALEGTEGNVCTSAQVAAIKAKGWHPLYCTEIDGNTSKWSEYPGNDDDPSTPGDNPSTPDGIAIDETNFPDANFRAYLLEQDYGKDGVLTEAEIARITEIDVCSGNISSLKGIEHFTALKYLRCWDNQLTTLDLSNNTALINMNCCDNQLTTLDISKNTALYFLLCNRNQLTSLDVSKNPALENLECNSNQLTSLDVSKNPALEHLECGHNPLNSLDVSSNTALIELMCQNTQLTTLDVSKNTALTQLYCYDNQLTALDVSENPALTALACSGNQLTSLDVSKNTALETLWCYDNQLTSLDMSKNTELYLLSCFENQIKGEDMDALISSLPEGTDGALYVYDESSSNEGNVMTKSQVATAKTKGWIPYYWDLDADMWMEYEGSDEETSGITRQGSETECVNNSVYTLSGQKVTSPVKGGVYIVNGKKVVVK